MDDVKRLLARLSLIWRGRPLFPSLRYLQLDNVWPFSLSEASLLFSPSIRTLRIGNTFSGNTRSKLGYRQHTQFCTSMLINRCPSLQEFTQKPLVEHDMVTSGMLDVLFGKMDLKSVKLVDRWYHFTFSREIALAERCRWVQKISRLPHLHTLTFDVTGITKHEILALGLGKFPSLEKLKLFGKPATILALLQSLNSTYTYSTRGVL